MLLIFELVLFLFKKKFGGGGRSEGKEGYGKCFPPRIDVFQGILCYAGTHSWDLLHSVQAWWSVRHSDHIDSSVFWGLIDQTTSLVWDDLVCLSNGKRWSLFTPSEMPLIHPSRTVISILNLDSLEIRVLFFQILTQQ